MPWTEQQVNSWAEEHGLKQADPPIWKNQLTGILVVGFLASLDSWLMVLKLTAASCTPQIQVL